MGSRHYVPYGFTTLSYQTEGLGGTTEVEQLKVAPEPKVTCMQPCYTRPRACLLMTGGVPHERNLIPLSREFSRGGAEGVRSAGGRSSSHIGSLEL